MHSAIQPELDPLKLFGVSHEEHSLLEYLYHKPRRSNGFSPNAVNYLMRRHLIRACRRGRILVITSAGKGSIEAIRLMMCT